MFNPFTLIDPRYLPIFKKKGEVAFVLQTYDRGRNLMSEPDKPAFLLAHYRQEHLAKKHYDAIADDPARRLLYTDNGQDWRELQRLSIDKEIYVYVYFKTADVNERAKAALDKKIRAFIDYKLGWKPGANTIKLNLEFTNGKIDVVLTSRRTHL